jgi:hypothetical protein
LNRRRIVDLVLGAVFLTSLAGVGLGMFLLRSSAIAAYGNEQGQAEWDRWRSDVAKDAQAFADATKSSGKGEIEKLPPVKRRVSKAAEPPALLLMRDRFAVCLIAALLMSGAMIGSVLLLVRGAILGAKPSKEGVSKLA